MSKILFPSLLLCMLTSCSELEQRPKESVIPSPQACPKCPDACPATIAEVHYDVPVGTNLLPATENILDYVGRFSGLSAEDQKKELVQINENLSLNKLDFNYRMKAGIIYAMPTTRLHDASKAQSFLDSLMREKSLDMQRKALVNLLRDYISENGKLALENTKLLQENTVLLQKSRDEQKRTDTLQQTLDNLKAIEKTMSDREQSLRK